MRARLILLVLVAWSWAVPLAQADVAPIPPPLPPEPECGDERRAVYWDQRWLCLPLHCASDADCPGEERCEDVCDFDNCVRRCERVSFPRPRRAAFRHGSTCSAAPSPRSRAPLLVVTASMAVLLLGRRRCRPRS